MSAANPRVQFTLRPPSTSDRTTTCDFAIIIEDIAVWPARGDDDVWLQIQIDDLLGYLTDFWKPLMLRQVYPIDVSPMRPSDLRRAAEQRWAELQTAAVEIEEEAVSNFEEAHDLARCFAGLFGSPPFWIFRSGDDFVLETAHTLWKLPFETVCSALSALGNEICERLAAGDEDRWGEAIRAWRHRDKADGAALLAWSVGLDRSLAKLLIEEGALEAPLDFNDAANDNNEVRIAARMAGALPPDQIREIITLARQFGRHNAEPLRRLSEACADFISDGFDRTAPFQQGEAAANFVREYIELRSDRAVDIFMIVAGLGVDVRHTAAEPPTLDGLAIWGARHGPGVFLNESSRRIVRNGEAVKDSLGARVTLAHELCHLLLDGRHALSAVEVLKARMPTGVEQRAKAFAGELLLPSRVAAQHWLEADRPTQRVSLNTLVEDLVDLFGVTRSVAAWKLEHGARSYDVELGAILDSVAPRR